MSKDHLQLAPFASSFTFLSNAVRDHARHTCVNLYERLFPLLKEQYATGNITPKLARSLVSLIELQHAVIGAHKDLLSEKRKEAAQLNRELKHVQAEIEYMTTTKGASEVAAGNKDSYIYYTTSTSTKGADHWGEIDE